MRKKFLRFTDIFKLDFKRTRRITCTKKIQTQLKGTLDTHYPFAIYVPPFESVKLQEQCQLYRGDARPNGKYPIGLIIPYRISLCVVPSPGIYIPP
jgi:hypothetical protein